ncbi:latrophilin-like protein LAT-2 [Tigriopus californicus]|nr:latrophilin-like protein LAT-2 [Tigriopus californicus]
MTDPGNEMNYHRNVTNTFDIVLDYVQIVSDLLHHELAWLEYDDDLILQNSTNLLKSAENIAFFLLQIEGAKVGFDRLITDSRDEVRMYTQSTFSRNESLPTMPRPPFIQLDGPSLIWGDWRSVGIQFCTQGIFDQIFHPSRNDLGLTSVELHSVAKISTFSINEWTPLASDGTVKVSFDHTNETEVRGTRYCVFWDEEELQWSQGGCVLSFESTLLNTVCICNHTTNFAVLFDVGGVLDDLSDVALTFLNILSTILCTVSAIGTLLTFAILLFSKLPSSPRTIIQMNRAFSLFCLYLLFLLGIDPTILGLPDWMCRGVAVFIHFFGLSSFFWTSLEGIQLYRALVNKRLSDDDGRYFKLLRFVIGYGISLVIVFLTLVIQFVLDADNAYEHENDEPEDEIALCWLRENSFIWAFVGPALAVILLNFIIMLRTVKVVYRVQKRINRRGLAEVKGHLKSWTILTFLLGITWASGLLINKVTAKYGAYIFVALNGSLGIFTFIHSILLNPSVLGELKIRLGILDKNEFNLNLGGDRANALKQYTRKNRRQGIKSELRHHQRPEYVTENSLEMSSPDECSLPTSSIGSSHRSPRQVPRLLNVPEPNRPGFLFGRRKSSIAQLSHRDRSQMVSSQQSSFPRVILAQGVGRAFAVPGPSKRINGSI